MTVVPLPLPSPINNLLLTNWASSVTMQVSYQTTVLPSRVDGAEERLGLIDRPSRELLSTFTGLDKNRSTQMWMNLARAGDQRTLQPLYQDQSEMTVDTVDRFDVPLQLNVTDITCPTDLQRFFLGGRILIAQTDGEQIVQSEVATIVAIVSGLLTVTQLATSYPANHTLVFPLLDVEVQLRSSGRFKTDQTFNVKVKSREVLGASALERTLTTPPAGQTGPDGKPIFLIPNNWTQAIKSSVVRAGKANKQGKSRTSSVRESRPRFAHELSVQDQRADIWPAIQFFDWAEGRRESFWLVAPNVAYTPVSISTTQIAVEPIGLLDDHQDFLENIAIVQTDGTVLIRGIASITEVSNEWRIVFDAVIPAISLSDIEYSTPAHRVRFQNDSYRERWGTTEWGQVSMGMVDVLAEEDVVIAAITPAVTEYRAEIQDIPDLYLWIDASGPAWTEVISNDPGQRAVADRKQFWPHHFAIPQDGIPVNPALPHAWSTSPEADFVFDVRQGPTDNSLTEPYLDIFNRPLLARLSRETFNNGLLTFHHPAIQSYGWRLGNSNAAFWDAANGMTLFVCARFGGRTTNEAHMHFVSRTGVFEWHTGVIRFFQTVDIPVANHSISYTQPDTSDLYIMAVRWVPSSVADLYINGGPVVASTPLAVPSINTTPRVTDILQFVGGAVVNPSSVDTRLEQDTMSNAFLMFQRGLSIAEMNIVGNYLANRYAATWVAVT